MCSFCLRAESEVARLIAGPGVYICDACVGRCEEILAGAPVGSTGRIVDWAGLDDEAMLGRLPRMSTVADQVEASMQAWVGELRGRGVTWERIGAALGMRRQSAWMRFGDRGN